MTYISCTASATPQSVADALYQQSALLSLAQFGSGGAVGDSACPGASSRQTRGAVVGVIGGALRRPRLYIYLVRLLTFEAIDRAMQQFSEYVHRSTVMSPACL
jgi:hypothetical protein